MLLTQNFDLASTSEEAVYSFEDLWKEIDRWLEAEDYVDFEMEELEARRAALESLVSHMK